MQNFATTFAIVEREQLLVVYVIDSQNHKLLNRRVCGE